MRGGWRRNLTEPFESLLGAAGFVFGEGGFHMQAFFIGEAALGGLGEFAQRRFPLLLIELGLAEVEIAVGVGGRQTHDGGEVTVGGVPLLALRGDHTEDHVSVHGAGLLRDGL